MKTFAYFAEADGEGILMRSLMENDADDLEMELLSNLVEIPFQANCRSVRRSRHPVDLAML